MLRFDKESRTWKLVRAQDRAATTRHVVQPRARPPKFVPQNRHVPGVLAFSMLGFNGARR